MKSLIVLFGAGLAAAAIALALDSPAFVLLSVALLVVVSAGLLVHGYRAAQQGRFVAPMAVVLAAGLGGGGLGVAAVVLGDRGDAPGLMLWGSALIACVVVGVAVLSARLAQRGSR